MKNELMMVVNNGVNLMDLNAEWDMAMTSLDMADLTGKEHKIIMRDIREEVIKITEGLSKKDGYKNEPMSENLVKSTLYRESVYKDAYGREKRCLELSERGALQLAAKYSAEVRFNLINAVFNLKAQNEQLLKQLIESQKQEIVELKDGDLKIMTLTEIVTMLNTNKIGKKIETKHISQMLVQRGLAYFYYVPKKQGTGNTKKIALTTNGRKALVELGLIETNKVMASPGEEKINFTRRFADVLMNTNLVARKQLDAFADGYIYEEVQYLDR